ncbi:MAG: hypothetical protein NTW78_04375 [Campylobacterales bacterium]|nr:hypothetical protein [Campylobacterales bacterium]
MKNFIVGFLTLSVVGLMAVTYMGGHAYQGGEHSKVIKDFGNAAVQQASTSATSIPVEKDDRAKEMDELSALRNKAGNAGAFNVSQEYKSKCSSCHGGDGSGFQNGKPMMGPKLFGQSADKIYQSLSDFKAGRKENLVMKGLLLNLEDADLRKFANEIGAFPERLKETQNK